MRLYPLLFLCLLPALADVPAAPAACGEPAPAASRDLLADWLGLLRGYAPVLHAGVEALAAVDGADKAQAALPAIRAVQAGDDAIRTASRALEAARCFAEDFMDEPEVMLAVQSLPVGRYHAERARILRAGCYGDVALYLALTGQEGRFSPGQVAAPISGAERAALARVQEVNRLLAAVRLESDSRKAGEKLLPLVREISAALPAMNPAALCEAERLRQETDSHLARMAEGNLFESRMFDALLLQPGSYLADSVLNTQNEVKVQFLARHPHPSLEIWPTAKQLMDTFRAAHAGAVAAFCGANGLGGGDGASPETPILLPAGLHPAERRALLRRFGREVLGDKFVPVLGENVANPPDGRVFTYVAGNAGRTGDWRFNEDQTVLVPFYFGVGPDAAAGQAK